MNPDAPPSPPVYIHSSDETYVMRFRVCGTRTTFRFNPVPDGVSEVDWIRDGFSQLVDMMKGEAAGTDQLGFTLQSVNLKNRDPGYVAFRPVADVDGDILWTIFGGILQSNAEAVKSTDTFRITCTRVNLPVGSGKNRVRGIAYNNFDKECKARKGIVVIANKDNLCLARALVVGKAHAKKDTMYELIRKNRRNRQTLKANKLMTKARVEIPEEGTGIPEIRRFQEHLRKYKITFYTYNRRGRDVYFEGPDSSLKINLLYHNGHFNVITSLTAAFACGYYCEPCHKPYDHRGEHRCQNFCPACLTTSPPCRMQNGGITCPQCNRHFRNQICFIAHKGEVCKNVRQCKDCGKGIFLRWRKSAHVCVEMYCQTCDDFKLPDHKCYIRVDTSKPKTQNFVFIFFDLETRQDEEDRDGAMMHRINLCVSQQFCYLCIKGEECDTCENRTRVFTEENPVVAFMDYVMDVRKAFSSVCVIAHNGQGFDFQFLLKYVLESTKFTPDLIMRGTKVVLMELANVRFVDSVNYFPMALAALPKAFELPPEKKKGYFPHLFNTVANQDYVGTMPAKEFYFPESMIEKGANDFDIWYAEQVRRGYVFDFKKELVEYCISDVDILAQACIRFRALFLQECNVDPFLEAVTIASACNKAFRRNFLKPNTIGLIPRRGYRMVDNQSAAALKWLTWEEDRRSVRIQHAGRGREVRIAGVKVDGFDGERVYEFQGCYYHGCPRCYLYDREKPLKDDDPSDTLQPRHQRTKAKTEKLSATYELIEMWECDFNRLRKQQNLTHLDSHPILNTLPLNPRDSFFGGRTGNAKTYHKIEEGETIQYVDVCSLYP